MTNTIHSVPRELLCELRDAANEGMNATTRQHQIDHFAGLIAKADALLSDPSPAGVDGLEVMAYRVAHGLNLTDLWHKKADAQLDAESVSGEVQPLCRLSDAQPIIDGLRVEVADLRPMLATVSKAGLRVRTERDQQARRICELEGLLREWRRMFDGGLASGQLGVLRGQTDAALSGRLPPAP